MSNLVRHTVIAAKGANIAAGFLLGLDAAQASVRAHNLETVEAATDKQPGVYRTTAAVMFKRGEEIGVDPALVSGAMFAEIAASSHEVAKQTKADVGKARAEATKKKAAADKKARAAADLAKSKEKTPTPTKSAGAAKPKPPAKPAGD